MSLSMSQTTFIERVLEASSVAPLPVSQQERRRHGIVYTPVRLASYVAHVVARSFLTDIRETTQNKKTSQLDEAVRNLRIIDPACGSGELLCAVWLQLCEEAKSDAAIWKSLQQHGHAAVLCGIDTDSSAIRRTKRRIRRAIEGQNAPRPRLRTLNSNALFPFSSDTSKRGWARARRYFDAHDGFDVVIANPPWGADVSNYRGRLTCGEFSLFQGQFDTSDLFLELALRIVRPGGYFGYIVPDSLFNHERRELRRLLLDNTEIRFVGRFGEGLFENVSRACTVVVCRKCAPSKSTRTTCLRLTPDMRADILNGRTTFAVAESTLGHRVRQSRFLQNPNFLFDIDVTSEEENVLQRFRGQASSFGEFLVSARGVELSKHGRVSRCNNCYRWMPYPCATKPRCPHCQVDVNLSQLESTSIVRSERSNASVPFVVGQSVRRYKIDQVLWIDMGKDGINYKPAGTYRPPKLLLRKTGVGVCAAIDYSPSYTNQVVYIFRPIDGVDGTLPLELFLGILNSRAIYYFVTKRYGETEWRSHPYLTQRQVLSLPMPGLAQLRGKDDVRIERIAKLLKPHITAGNEPPPSVDAEVERTVAQLYGLTRKDYQTIYTTIESVQDLVPVRALRRVALDDIFPERRR